MISIVLNNQKHNVDSGTLLQLTSELSINVKGVAIAVNNRVIARPQWSDYMLQEGDSIVIVSAVFGG